MGLAALVFFDLALLAGRIRRVLAFAIAVQSHLAHPTSTALRAAASQGGKIDYVVF